MTRTYGKRKKVKGKKEGKLRMGIHARTFHVENSEAN
jgi:hypothetical protein